MPRLLQCRRFQPEILKFKHPTKKDKKGKPVMYALKVTQAPEPSNVIWENVETSEITRMGLKIRSKFITLALMLIAVVLIYGLSKTSESMASGVVTDQVCDSQIPAAYFGKYPGENFTIGVQPNEWSLYPDQSRMNQDEGNNDMHYFTYVKNVRYNADSQDREQFGKIDWTLVSTRCS